MVRFVAAPIEDVVPKRRLKQPSARAQIQMEYRQALQEALERNEALVVELEDGDKPLTIRNRVKRAGELLGLENLTIRRQKDRIVAYRVDEYEVPRVGTDDALGG